MLKKPPADSITIRLQVYKAKDINTGALVALKKTRLEVSLSNAFACPSLNRSLFLSDGRGGRSFYYIARSFAPSDAEREQPYRQVSIITTAVLILAMHQPPVN